MNEIGKEIASRFKTNLLTLLNEIIYIVEDKKKDVGFLRMISNMTSIMDAEVLFTNFIEKIDEREANGKTFRELQEEGNFYAVYHRYVSNFSPTGYDLQANMKIEELDPDDREIIFTAINSFFTLEKEYRKNVST